MKVLIAVKSCMKAWMAGEHDAIRDSWGKDLPLGWDLRFFFGDGTGWMLGPYNDEIHLRVPDTYETLPIKVRAMTQWAVLRGYDYIYLCDNDTFLDVGRLKGLLSYNLNADYLGKFYWEGKDPTEWKGKYRFAFGGFGYFLSRRAMEIVANAPLPTITEEDQWVGSLLYGQPITTKEMNLERFGHWIAWHYPKDVYAGFPRYRSETKWQQSMYQYHITKESPEWPLFGTYLPDVRMFPSRVEEYRLKVPITTIWDKIAYLRQDKSKNLDLIISYAALQEIQEKELEAVTYVEWWAAAQCYRNLGRRDAQLWCAVNASRDDNSLVSQIKLAEAYDFAGRYVKALEIVAPLFQQHKDNKALETLHARLQTLSMVLRKES